jgi:hypothetical protein
MRKHHLGIVLGSSLMLALLIAGLWRLPNDQDTRSEGSNPGQSPSREREIPSSRTQADTRTTTSRRAEDRICHEILAGLTRELEALEQKRIVDESSAVKVLKVSENMRTNFQVPAHREWIDLKNDYLVIRAPGPTERSEIESLVESMLSSAPFENAAAREAAGKKLLKKFLNYPNGQKLVEANTLSVEGQDNPHVWINVFNTDQIEEIEGKTGIILSSQNAKGFERFKDARHGGVRRYGHLWHLK